MTANASSSASPPPSRLRSRLTLLLIVAMFFGSFGVAVFLRFTGWEPTHTRNYGELLKPPVDLNASVLVLESDAHWNWRNEEREWTALVRLPENCDEDCWQRLAMLPRVRVALGGQAARLHLLVLERALPAERRAALAPMQGAASVAAVPLPFAASASAPELWLVDPHGYAVLHYPPGFDPSGLRKDLGKLLK